MLAAWNMIHWAFSSSSTLALFSFNVQMYTDHSSFLFSAFAPHQLFGLFHETKNVQFIVNCFLPGN